MAKRNRMLIRLDHELKNPLTALRTSAATIREVARQGGSIAEVEPAAKQVDLSSRRVARLLADLRKLADVETRIIEYSRVDLDRLIHQAVEDASTAPGAEDRMIVATVARAPWRLPDVAGEEDLLLTAILNLLGNALKYSSQAEVVELRANEQIIDNHRWVVVEVADTGGGIPISEQDQVWDELSRGSRVRAVAGSGMGLSLVRSIVARHGGSVRLFSQEGVGTSVRMVLPVLADAAPVGAPPMAEGGERARGIASRAARAESGYAPCPRVPSTATAERGRTQGPDPRHAEADVETPPRTRRRDAHRPVDRRVRRCRLPDRFGSAFAVQTGARPAARPAGRVASRTRAPSTSASRTRAREHIGQPNSGPQPVGHPGSGPQPVGYANPGPDNRGVGQAGPQQSFGSQPGGRPYPGGAPQQFPGPQQSAGARPAGPVYGAPQAPVGSQPGRRPGDPGDRHGSPAHQGQPGQFGQPNRPAQYRQSGAPQGQAGNPDPVGSRPTPQGGTGHPPRTADESGAQGEDGRRTGEEREFPTRRELRARGDSQ